MNVKQITQAKNSSRSFHKAFQRVMECRPISTTQFEMLAVPGVVCVAFAIELGFKALLLQKGVQARGHELDSLFRKLGTAERAELIRVVGITESDFSKELEDAANTFVDWRYIYEYEEATDEEATEVSANVDFLQRLSEAVQGQLDRSS